MTSSSNRVTILGVPVDAVTAVSAVVRIEHLLDSGGKHHVITPNSEMLVEASRNEDFCAVLNRSALNLPDSTGLVLAAWFTGQHLPERVTGVDTVERLCLQLTEEHPVFLLGAAEGVAQRAARRLQERNPHLRIAGTYAGSPERPEAPEIVRRINESGAHLLLVAYGAPRQDLWIDAHLQELATVRVAIGVGGTFDFLAKVQRRAPGIVRKLGFEWLWRLCQDPRRCKRIWNAAIVFPWLVVRYGRGGGMTAG